MTLHQRTRQVRRGLTIVETAVVISLVLLLIFGTYEYGRFVMVRQVIHNAAREGARLAVVDLHAERAEETAKRLGREASADAFAMGLDVRSEEDMDAMVSRTLERFGRIDILVHAAGILHPPGSRPRLLVEISTEEWDTIVGTNLRGTFLANRAAARAMIRQKEGHIVNLSSTMGRKAEAVQAYALAVEYAPQDEIYVASLDAATAQPTLDSTFLAAVKPQPHQEEEPRVTTTPPARRGISLARLEGDEPDTTGATSISDLEE